MNNPQVRLPQEQSPLTAEAVSPDVASRLGEVALACRRVKRAAIGGYVSTGSLLAANFLDNNELLADHTNIRVGTAVATFGFVAGTVVAARLQRKCEL